MLLFDLESGPAGQYNYSLQYTLHKAQGLGVHSEIHSLKWYTTCCELRYTKCKSALQKPEPLSIPGTQFHLLAGRCNSSPDGWATITGPIRGKVDPYRRPCQPASSVSLPIPVLLQQSALPNLLHLLDRRGLLGTVVRERRISVRKVQI